MSLWTSHTTKELNDDCGMFVAVVNLSQSGSLVGVNREIWQKAVHVMLLIE